MSGSPVYIDGKLMGAIAYAWSFAKEPLGGVTPIEIDAGRAQPPAPRERREYFAAGDGDASPAPRATCARPAPHDRAAAPAALARGLGLPPDGPGAAAGEPRLVRASVPLSVAGFTPRTFAELEQELRPSGLVPLQAGGGRRPGPPARRPRRAGLGHRRRAGPRRHEHRRHRNGHLRRTAATCFAFGHPMFGIGEVYLPMVDAEIHDVPAQPVAVVQDVVAAARRSARWCRTASRASSAISTRARP